jgi:Uma2 family endonuclease
LLNPYDPADSANRGVGFFLFEANDWQQEKYTLRASFSMFQQTAMPEVKAKRREASDELQEPITSEEFLAMGEMDGRYELVEGQIVEVDKEATMGFPSFRHGQIEVRLGRHLDEFVQEHALGHVAGGEVGIYTERDPDTLRGADMVFVSNERFGTRSPEATYLDVAPELIVEIISPSNFWGDMRDKLKEYFDLGTERVWVVESENEAVLVFRSPTDLTELEAGDTLDGEGALDGFSVPIETLFAA